MRTYQKLEAVFTIFPGHIVYFFKRFFAGKLIFIGIFGFNILDFLKFIVLYRLAPRLVARSVLVTGFKTYRMQISGTWYANILEFTQMSFVLLFQVGKAHLYILLKEESLNVTA